VDQGGRGRTDMPYTRKYRCRENPRRNFHTALKRGYETWQEIERRMEHGKAFPDDRNI